MDEISWNIPQSLPDDEPALRADTASLSADHRAAQEWEMIYNVIPAMGDEYLVRYTLDYIDDCEEEPISKALLAEVKRRGLNLC